MGCANKIWDYGFSFEGGIEGSEYETLLATPPPVLARIGRIALEYHGDSAPYTKDQLFEHLHRSGFSSAWDVCDKSGYGLTEMIFQKTS